MQVWEVQFLKKWKNWESFISFVYSYHSSELKKRSSQRNFAIVFFRDKQISKFTYVIYKFCSFYVKKLMIYIRTSGSWSYEYYYIFFNCGRLKAKLLSVLPWVAQLKHHYCRFITTLCRQVCIAWQFKFQSKKNKN